MTEKQEETIKKLRKELELTKKEKRRYKSIVNNEMRIMGGQ